MQIPNKPNISSSSFPLSKKKSESSQKTSKLEPEAIENRSFLDILDSIIPGSDEPSKALNELWRDLPDIEREVIRSKSRDSLEKYKKHIKSIADLVMKLNYRVVEAPKRFRDTDPGLRYRKILDEKLHLLTTTTFTTAAQILKQLDEIRGILVDLRG